MSGTSLAGLSALVHVFNVSAPVREPRCISEQNIKGHIRQERGWTIYSKRHELEPTIQAHLNFAMRRRAIFLNFQLCARSIIVLDCIRLGDRAALL